MLVDFLLTGNLNESFQLGVRNTSGRSPARTGNISASKTNSLQAGAHPLTFKGPEQVSTDFSSSSLMQTVPSSSSSSSTGRRCLAEGAADLTEGGSAGELKCVYLTKKKRVTSAVRSGARRGYHGNSIYALQTRPRHTHTHPPRHPLHKCH